MRKMISLFFVCMMLVALFIVFFPIGLVKASENILYVGGSGPGNYSSIQDAINYASAGDTVFVYAYSSPYFENLVIDKSITLMGETKDTSIIDGAYSSYTVLINADLVNIKGFTIRSGFIGIDISSEYNTISGNIIRYNTYGISLTTSSANSILDNIISNNAKGIVIDNSSSNTITSNNIVNNNNNGIQLSYSNSNTIISNNISSNNEFGILIYESSNYNTFYHNNFIDNTQNAYDKSNNTWDDGYPSGGNYWDDYAGVDDYMGSNQDIPGGDGIGDTPYNIAGGSSQDRYPLMGPWINHPPNLPNDPDPQDGATGVSIITDLSWTGGDPDGDAVTYDVYFGTTSPFPLVVNNQIATIYDLPGFLQYKTTYYWQIVAWDEHGSSTTGPVWSFTTIQRPNQPPNKPSNPNPANGEIDVDIDTNLSWTGGDPDPGDTVTYDIYFGISSPPPRNMSNQSATTYDPGALNYDTTYYWWIDARDSYGLESQSDIWMFSTEKKPPSPPPSIDPIVGVGAIAGSVGVIYTIYKFRLKKDGKKKKIDKKKDEEEEEEEEEKKEAAYRISAVKYDKKHAHIVKVKTHKYKDKKMKRKYIIEDRKTVIKNLRNKKIYHTTVKDDFGIWKKGGKVRIIKVKNKEFIRTDDNETEEDNLEELPEF